MSRTNKRLAATSSILVLAAALVLSLVDAGPPSDKDFKADDAVETLAVTIQVGADGDDLTEPVALDLGLGFPFWLGPVGRGPDEPAPFGAVPQEASERGQIAAGSSATFTFRAKGDPGLDALQVTPQLLAGLRVSDIARVGFSSRGASNWSLAGYEININGKPFASGKPGAAAAALSDADRGKVAELDAKIAAVNKDLSDLQDLVKTGLATDADRTQLANAEASLKSLLKDKEKLTGGAGPVLKAKTAQDAALQKLADLNLKITPLQTERADLAELVRTQLATADDRQRLEDLTSTLAQLTSEKARLEGQLDGKYPWFVDAEFRSPWRGQAEVKSARVTLVTQTHAGADTSNYVYVRTGGHKYQLSSPTTPLTGTAGPQVFALDLLAGPLTAADMRGWALGMLAQPTHYGQTPDRWHPQRLIVEIDGRVVYDSEDSDLDRRSLEAIRLIPPAHFNKDGQIVANTPISRETFVWEAGKGAGLDEKGGVLPLPQPTDPTFPEPEPGLPDQIPTPEPLPPDVPADQQPPTDFPGELPLPPEDAGVPAGGWWLGIDWGPGPGPWGPGGWGPGGWGPGDGGPGGGGLADLLAQIWQQLGWLAGLMGPPPQIQNPEITAGWRVGGNFTITWQVVGDENSVDHYQVSLVPVRPDLANPFPGPSIALGTTPRGVHTLTAPLGPLPPGVNVPGLFLAPVVSAIPINPLQLTTNSQPGPARAIFRAGSVAAEQPFLSNLRTRFWHIPPAYPPGAFAPPLPGADPFPVPAVWHPLGISPGPTPGTRSVWEAGPVVSHNAIAFDPANPGRHVGAQPLMAGDTILVGMTAPLPAGRRRLVAHLGFLGGAGATGTANARMFCCWYDAFGTPVFAYHPVPGVPGLPKFANSADPMPTPFEMVVDPADAPTATSLRIQFRIGGGPFDANHPPALFGVRLIPEP